MARLKIAAPTSHTSEEIDTIDYFGSDIRINPGFTDADLIDFLEEVDAVDEDDPKAGALTKNFLRQAVHPDDFEHFWALGKQHRQSMEDRMAVAYAVLEVVTGRPTEQPSGSPAGPALTAASSTADFALAAQRKLEADGRADLAVAALRHREALAVRQTG